MFNLIFRDDFNSIKVQLEPSFSCAARLSSAWFQFHKGTIRTFLIIGYSNFYTISIP